MRSCPAGSGRTVRHLEQILPVLAAIELLFWACGFALVDGGCGRIGFDAQSVSDGDTELTDAGLSDSKTGDSLADAATTAMLESRGLLVRYLLDDDISTGQVRSTTGALPLTVSASAGISTDGLPTGLGLGFTEPVGGDARACAPIAGTTLESTLNGSMTGTIELVADITEGAALRSRLADIGVDFNWSFSAGYSTLDATTAAPGFFFDMNGVIYERGIWPIDASSLGRAVLTFVYDSRQLVEEDRVRMYIDGAIQDNVAVRMVVENETLALGPAELCVGNRATGQRSPVASIYYVAYYSSALTPGEIGNNAIRLLGADD